MKTIKIFTEIANVKSIKKNPPLEPSSIETKINKIINELHANICDVKFSTQIMDSLYIQTALVVLETKEKSNKNEDIL